MLKFSDILETVLKSIFDLKQFILKTCVITYGQIYGPKDAFLHMFHYPVIMAFKGLKLNCQSFNSYTIVGRSTE